MSGAGLTLMGVRLYNPVTGLFTSLDPVEGGNANAHTYPADPINKFDTDGQREAEERHYRSNRGDGDSWWKKLKRSAKRLWERNGRHRKPTKWDHFRKLCRGFWGKVACFAAESVVGDWVVKGLGWTWGKIKKFGKWSWKQTKRGYRWAKRKGVRWLRKLHCGWRCWR